MSATGRLCPVASHCPQTMAVERLVIMSKRCYWCDQIVTHAHQECEILMFKSFGDRLNGGAQNVTRADLAVERYVAECESHIAFARLTAGATVLATRVA